MDGRLARGRALPELPPVHVVSRPPCGAFPTLIPDPAHGAMTRREQASDTEEQRRPPRARRTGNRGYLSTPQLQVDATQNGVRRQTRTGAGGEPFMESNHLERERHGDR